MLQVFRKLAGCSPLNTTVHVRSVVVLVGVLMALSAAPSRAATYSYQSQPFTIVVPPYTTSMSTSGSFDLALALPSNLALTPVVPTAFSFFDGQQARTLGDSVICDFQVGTDASGAIDKWMIYVMEDVAPGNPRHTITSNRVVTAGESAGIIPIASTTAIDCAGTSLNPFGSNDGVPGSWTRIGAAPSLPAWGFLLLAGLLVVVGVRSLHRIGARPAA